MADQLASLTDGKLNLAMQDDLAVDWSVLELRVAPTFPALTNTLVALADAMVRGGIYASSNFGTATTMTVKGIGTGDFDRRALLRWDVRSVLGRVVHAVVRLVPVAVGATNIEHAVRFVSNDTWGETNVTWQNQPASQYRFGSWVPVANQPVEFVVTPQVQEALAGDGLLSLQIFSTLDFGGNGSADYATRENSIVTNQPQLIVIVSNTPPQISDITDRFAPTNVAVGPIQLTVGDGETPAGALTLRAVSSNTNLIPTANISFGGTSSNRTVTVTHSGTLTGAVTITVFVDDGALTNSDSFRITVGASNTPPVLLNLNDRTIPEDGTSGAIPFTIGDKETPASALLLSVTCSDTNLIPLANILLGGSASNRNVTVTPAPNLSGMAVITITVDDGSMTTNDSFTVTVTPVNDPPNLIVMTSPADGARFTSAETIPLGANATDPDGNLARVDFFANGTLVASDSGNPYSFGWPRVGMGNYALRAVAVDGNGLSLTSAPVNITVEPAPEILVPLGAMWRYLDTGIAPAANWTTLAFNDSTWATGAAELGFGDDDETTETGYGPEATNKFITTWFRHAFVVPEALPGAGLLLRIVRDDGAIVYLNGAEIFRSNMPTGAVNQTTRAITGITGAAETNFISTSLPLSLLMAGTNQLAVEIHQNSPTSSDLSFNLELAVTNPPITALVATGSVWRYLDTSVVPAANWKTLAFDDSGWLSGPAQLGYGDGDEATLVFSNRARITTYFRRTFVPPALGTFAQYTLNLLRDDGAVVYLNGTEIFRSNMPTGLISDATFAPTGITGSEENEFQSTNVLTASLLGGTNILAVEIHQNGTNSSDLSFDLELTAYPPAALPQLEISAVPSSVLLRWPAWAGGFQPYVSPNLAATSWSAVPDSPAIVNGTQQVVLPRSSARAFFRLGKP
jgi:hypothetical protein